MNKARENRGFQTHLQFDEARQEGFRGDNLSVDRGVVVFLRGSEDEEDEEDEEEDRDQEKEKTNPVKG